ncbi:MAG TPA: amidohydrolase family protein [Ilumatobacteraceae bacterium]|nr:amidohydrolase family protein [Ilumatobacteraceae bacterium]
MTDEPFIDTHIHFWDRSVTDLEWSWLKPGFSFRHWESSASLDVPRFSTPELLDESEGSGLAAIVHGHSADPIDDPAVETAWLESVAENHRMPDAIVGKCSLAAPDAVDVMRRHATYPRFRGVRDPAALQHLDVEEIATAMDAAGVLGISVEVRREHQQFEVLHELADRWPGVTIALSHACLPLVRSNEQLAEWTGAMRGLAVHPNVVCKISAVAGASDPDWTVDSIRPWILACVDLFGADRCMLGSNWPVDRLFGTYRQLVDAYRSVTDELDPADRAAVFHGTAERVYRIDLAG